MRTLGETLHNEGGLQPVGIFLEALALYEARPDKSYSLTDCLSMQVMRREGLTDVLTNDHTSPRKGFISSSRKSSRTPTEKALHTGMSSHHAWRAPAPLFG